MYIYIYMFKKTYIKEKIVSKLITAGRCSLLAVHCCVPDRLQEVQERLGPWPGNHLRLCLLSWIPHMINAFKTDNHPGKVNKKNQSMGPFTVQLHQLVI